MPEVVAAGGECPAKCKGQGRSGWIWGGCPQQQRRSAADWACQLITAARQILKIAANVNGVAGVREAIAIPNATPAVGAVTPQLPEPPSLQEVALAPVAVDAVSRPSRLASDRTAAAPVAAPVQSPVMTTPYRAQAAPVGAMPASAAAPMTGQPVPMAPYAAVGAPRYDSPNMPNYAWPGYAAYPNYAALTYPQQYSPFGLAIHWPLLSLPTGTHGMEKDQPGMG